MGTQRDRILPLFALAAGAIATARAADPYDIHVIPAADRRRVVPLGTGHRDSFEALAEVANKAGGHPRDGPSILVSPTTVEPQWRCRSQRPCSPTSAGILGSSLVAMCAAIAPLMKNGPVDYLPVARLPPAPGSFVFSTSASAIDHRPPSSAITGWRAGPSSPR